VKEIKNMMNVAFVVKTADYYVVQSYASREQNEFEVYDSNDNPLGYFVESFNEFNESQYEIYSLESTEFGDISHEEYNRIDYTNSFQSAIDKLIENNDYA
jgi:hypothetical protein